MSQYNYKCEVVDCMPEYPFLNDRHRADARLTVNLYKDSKESMDYMIKGVGLLVEVNVRHAKDGSYISDMQHQPLPVIEIDLLGSAVLVVTLSMSCRRSRCSGSALAMTSAILFGR